MTTNRSNACSYKKGASEQRNIENGSDMRPKFGRVYTVEREDNAHLDVICIHTVCQGRYHGY